jgi:hypothetical protein
VGLVFSIINVGNFGIIQLLARRAGRCPGCVFGDVNNILINFYLNRSIKIIKVNRLGNLNLY